MADKEVKKPFDSTLEDDGLAEHPAQFPCPDQEAHLKVSCWSKASGAAAFSRTFNSSGRHILGCPTSLKRLG